RSAAHDTHVTGELQRFTGTLQIQNHSMLCGLDVPDGTLPVAPQVNPVYRRGRAMARNPEAREVTNGEVVERPVEAAPELKEDGRHHLAVRAPAEKIVPGSDPIQSPFHAVRVA